MNTLKISLGIVAMLGALVGAIFLTSSATTRAAGQAAMTMAMGDPAKSGHAGCPMMGETDENAEMTAYAFSAVVRKVDPENKRITLQHEKIGDYMDAMTMPFAVRDAELLKGLEVGAQRFFALHVMGDRSMIVGVSETLAGAQKLVEECTTHAGKGSAGHGDHGTMGKCSSGKGSDGHGDHGMTKGASKKGGCCGGH